MPHSFSVAPSVQMQRSVFDRSHGVKTTFDAGYLIPLMCEEILPGDTFNVKMALFARLATPIFPIMDNIYLDCFFFFVPNRLVWDNWQRFCGEQLNPGDSTDYLIPQVVAGGGGFGVGSVYDYMGIPTGVPNLSVNALPFRGLNLVYNEWFRDQNLILRLNVRKDDGPDPNTDYALRKRGKRHDYFTSCLPWPQKGPGVTLPLAGFADVVPGVGTGPTFKNTLGTTTWDLRPRRLSTDPGFPTSPGPFAGANQLSGTALATGADAGKLDWLSPDLRADLSTSQAVTINTMREAFQIQRLLERDARGGSRYTEINRSHFGVISPDARLQRPEYLGGGSVPVVVNPVTQNSEGTSPVGRLAAFGTASSNRFGFTKSFVEHGYVFCLISARADLTYQQGVNRMWNRKTRYDFYWPAFANLGEQAVLNKEIFATGVGDPVAKTGDYAAFGYNERWSEYRYAPSKITGRFRSSGTVGLDAWHLAQYFSALPSLAQSFIEENPPIARVVAVTSEPQFLLDSYFQVRAARPMPMFSVPGLIDHF